MENGVATYDVSHGGKPVTNDTLYRLPIMMIGETFLKVAMGFVDGKFLRAKKLSIRYMFDLNCWTLG
jgi:hypothetical protein